MPERGLRPTTAEPYRWLLRLHLLPTFGDMDLDEIIGPRCGLDNKEAPGRWPGALCWSV
ncbi:hypothetical protein [Streptomyces sp. 8N706]|uniref:hypothetical protein n=1 Tax=Streptomyces sp. 8N706 TaxID=3457416 RepID=UPI003FD00678